MSSSIFESFLKTAPANTLKSLLSVDSLLAVRLVSKSTNVWANDAMSRIFETGYISYPASSNITAKVSTSVFESFLRTAPANIVKSLLSVESLLAVRLVSKSMNVWTNDVMSRIFETGYLSYPASGNIVTLYTDTTWIHAFEKVVPHIEHLVICVLPCRRENLTILAATTLHTIFRCAAKLRILTLRITHHPVRLSEIILASTGALLYVYPTFPPLMRESPTHHFPIVSIRKQLEDVNPPNLKVLRLPKTSIAAIIALRWGVLAQVPSGLMATPLTSPNRAWINIHDFVRASENPFWEHIVEVDVQLVKWWDVILPSPPRGFAFGPGRKKLSAAERATDDVKADIERYRMGIVALYDWLSHLSTNLEVLRFEWLELDQQRFVAAPSARALIEGYQAEEPQLLSDGRYARFGRGPNIFQWEEVNSEVEGVGTIWFRQPKIVWGKLKEVWVGGMGPVGARKVQECAEHIRWVGVGIDGSGTVGYGLVSDRSGQVGARAYGLMRFTEDSETESETESDSEEEERARRAAMEGLRRGIMGGLGLDG